MLTFILILFTIYSLLTIIIIKRQFKEIHKQDMEIEEYILKVMYQQELIKERDSLIKRLRKDSDVK